MNEIAQNHEQIMELRAPQKPEIPIDRYKTIEKLKAYVKAYNAARTGEKGLTIKQAHRDTVEHIYAIYINTYNFGKKGLFKYALSIQDTQGNKLHCPRFQSNGAALKSRLGQSCINAIGRHFKRLEEADLVWTDQLVTDGQKIRKAGAVSTLVITIRPDILVFKQSNKAETVINALFDKPITVYLQDIGLEAVTTSKDKKEQFYYSPLAGTPRPGGKSKPSLAVNIEKDVWYDHHLKKGGDMSDFVKYLILNPPQAKIDSS
jgi:hypothetical protein